MARVLLVRSSAFRTSRLSKCARVLREDGHDVSILNWNRGIDDDPSPQRQELDEAGFSIDDIYVGHAPYARGIWGIGKRVRYMTAVARYVLQHDIDVVHAVDLDSALPVALLKATGAFEGRFVFDVADYIELYFTIPDFLGRIVGKAGGWVLKQADCVLLPDENRKERLPEGLDAPVTIVTNSPDFDEVLFERMREASAYSSDLDVFYYGSLADDRGVDLFVEAAADLPDVRFCFAGWGENEDLLQQVSEQRDNVEFFGMLSRTDVLHRAAQMDVIAMVYDPSFGVNKMASPNKLFEAMAIGRPVLVARNTSIDDLVERDKIGWVTDYSVTDLVATLRSIQPEELNRCAERAREVYQYYRWEKSAERLREAYADMLHTV